MKTILLSMLVISIGLVHADTPSQSEAHQLVDKMVAALGGEKAIKKIETRITTAEMEMPAQGMKMNVVLSQKAPNKVHVVQELPGLLKSTQGYNGSKGWSEDTLQGKRDIEGDELDNLKRESSIRREITMKQDYPKMTVLPDVEENGVTYKVVEAESSDGRKETWFFDSKTHLMAKTKQNMSLGPQGKIDVEVVFKDYREVDGVKIPHLSEIKNPAFSMTLRLTDIKQNVNVDDALFEKPAA